MKKYTHKSGKYIAKQDIYGYYEVILFKGNGTDVDRNICSWGKDLSKDWIEDSNDWIEMVEVPVGEFYSKKELINILPFYVGESAAVAILKQLDNRKDKQKTEVTLTSFYEHKQIENAFRKFLEILTIHGQPMSYPKKLRFEEIFFQYLLEQKK